METRTTERSRMLLVIGAMLVVVGAAITIFPAPFLHIFLERVIVGVPLVVVGAVLLAVGPRRSSRLALMTGILWALVLLAGVRTAAVLVTGIDDATGGAHPHVSGVHETADDILSGSQEDGREDPTVTEALEHSAEVDRPLVVSDSALITSTIYHPRRAGIVLAIGRDLLTPLLLLTSALATLGLLKRVRAGDPFGRGSVRLVRGLGVLLLVGIPLQRVLESVAVHAATAGNHGTTGLIAGDPVTALPSASSIVPGLLLLVVAAAWQHGADLAELEQGTV